MSTAADITREAERWTQASGRSLEAVNDIVSAPLIDRDRWSWRAWWISIVISLALTVVMLVTILWLFDKGIGIFMFDCIGQAGRVSSDQLHLLWPERILQVGTAGQTHKKGEEDGTA